MTKDGRVLVGMDFIGVNFPSALYSLQRWAAYLAEGTAFEPVIGVTTSCAANDPLPDLSSLTAREAVHIVRDCASNLKVLHWHTGIDKVATMELLQNGITSLPFWPDFSYGGVVNRLLLLATVSRCDFIVRVDPGTLPPAEMSFEDIMRVHISSIGTTSAVVSRGYQGRLALRDTFVVKEKSADHCDLVRDLTGVDARAQVTGGAMFTSRVPGIPAPAFPAYDLASRRLPTLVWASDDGIYQTLSSTTSSTKINRVEVPRFDAVGKPKPTREYYRGVAGAVFLRALRTGDEHPHEHVRVFLQRLDEMLDDAKCRNIDGNAHWREEFNQENVAPNQFLDRIREGWTNYQHLCQEWARIATVLKDRIGLDSVSG